MLTARGEMRLARTRIRHGKYTTHSVPAWPLARQAVDLSARYNDRGCITDKEFIAQTRGTVNCANDSRHTHTSRAGAKDFRTTDHPYLRSDQHAQWARNDDASPAQSVMMTVLQGA